MLLTLLLNLLGVAAVMYICWLLSWNRKQVPWRMVARALAAEILIALLVVKVPFGRRVITWLSNGLTAVINCGGEGLTFVFGDLADAGRLSVFIVQGLGNIIFVSALISVLHWLGVIGVIVRRIGKAVGRLLGASEVESFVAVANMFLGHTDSPILVARYLGGLTKSEIFVILVSGMGSMSAAILGGYSALGIPMEYLLIASAMVPVGSILIARIICPQMEQVRPAADVRMNLREGNTNLIDALAQGANTGMQMVLSIAATLVGGIGMVALANLLLGLLGTDLSAVLAWVFAPFGLLLGLQGDAILLEGSLLGSKMLLNEFIAFGDLAPRLAALDARTGLICTISLCGFANLSSMGMCVGGIGVLCPEKRGLISQLVFRAMLGGALVSILSALLVSMASLI